MRSSAQQRHVDSGELAIRRVPLRFVLAPREKCKGTRSRISLQGRTEDGFRHAKSLTFKKWVCSPSCMVKIYQATTAENGSIRQIRTSTDRESSMSFPAAAHVVASRKRFHHRISALSCQCEPKLGFYLPTMIENVPKSSRDFNGSFPLDSCCQAVRIGSYFR
jgi:hypothetical protein